MDKIFWIHVQAAKLVTARNTTAINPFTAPACRISGLKIKRTNTPDESIFWGFCNKSNFNIVRFDKKKKNPFTY